MRRRPRLLAARAALLIALAGVAGCTANTTSGTEGPETGSHGPGPCGTVATAPTYKHVIWIWMENHSYGEIIGNSQAAYINSLASECGLATNYHNVSHPSLPNYIAATSGRAKSVIGGIPVTAYLDCSPSIACEAAGTSIFGQGESWKSYEESMPSNCDKANSGEYTVRHNPAVYYTSLSRCSAFDVPYSQLAADLAGNKLPAFSFITPNLIDDMHDGTIAQGNAWLRANLPAILSSSAYTSGTTAIFITWDEGSGGSATETCYNNTADQSCHVPAIVISPSTRAGTSSGTFFNHYGLLATTEQLLGLPAIRQAASATTMKSAFNL